LWLLLKQQQQPLLPPKPKLMPLPLPPLLLPH
jgi:hypothetical protein